LSPLTKREKLLVQGSGGINQGRFRNRQLGRGGVAFGFENE
jgi:hypothetical protein